MLRDVLGGRRIARRRASRSPVGWLAVGVAHARASTTSARRSPMPSASSSLRLRSGIRPCGSQDHHDHEQEAEDPEAELGEVEVQPELARHVVEDVRDQAGC